MIRRETYEKVRAILKPYGRTWDNPANDDLILTSDVLNYPHR